WCRSIRRYHCEQHRSEATGRLSGSQLRQYLAAILVADVAGFSRLMALDERATVAALDAAREMFRSAIHAHGGRVVDMAGESVLGTVKNAAMYDDQGSHKVKNIAEPIHAFAVRIGSASRARSARRRGVALAIAAGVVVLLAGALAWQRPWSRMSSAPDPAAA